MNNNIIIFKTSDEKVAVDVTLEGETFWLTQEQIASLFERERSVITKHLRNIFKEGELNEKEVCANFAHTTQHGAIKGATQEREVRYYNLEGLPQT